MTRASWDCHMQVKRAKFQIYVQIFGKRINWPIVINLASFNRTGTKPSLAGSFCGISSGKSLFLSYCKLCEASCKWLQMITRCFFCVISGSVSDVLRINHKWKQKFRFKCYLPTFLSLSTSLCHINCSDNIVFHGGCRCGRPSVPCVKISVWRNDLFFLGSN